MTTPNTNPIAQLNKEKNEPITTKLLEKLINISSKKALENVTEGKIKKS